MPEVKPGMAQGLRMARLLLVLAASTLLLPSLAVGSVTVTVNGVNYTIPQTNERNWGTNVTSWIQAISGNTLQPSGGTFTLGADVDFGSSFGLKSTYYKTRTANASSIGQFRLANADTICFRNNANAADLCLGPNTGTNGVIQYNSVDLVGTSLTQTLTNKSIAASEINSGQLAIANGGTGAATKAAAFDALSPMTTGGDIIYGGASGTGTRLANGTSGQVLTSSGGTSAPTWSTVLVNPMTTGGDLIYGGSSGSPTRLANGSAGDYLRSAGGSSAPAWVSPAYYSGYLTAGTDWTTTSSTYADPGSGATIALTDIISTNMGTAAAAASSKAGITLTLPFTGVYAVTATIEAFVATGAATPSFRIVDGSGTVISPGVSATVVVNADFSTTLSGLYSGTAGSTTFKIQGATNANTLHINNGQATGTPAIAWTVRLLR